MGPISDLVDEDATEGLPWKVVLEGEPVSVNNGLPRTANTLRSDDITPGQAAKNVEEHIIGEAHSLVVAVCVNRHDGSMTKSISRRPVPLLCAGHVGGKRCVARGSVYLVSGGRCKELHLGCQGGGLGR